jgi:hypothetical protein
MVKNRQKGITKGYRNDKKDVNTRFASFFQQALHGISNCCVAACVVMQAVLLFLRMRSTLVLEINSSGNRHWVKFGIKSNFSPASSETALSVAAY